MKDVIENALAFRNPVKAQVFGKDGNLKFETEGFNGIVTEGLHRLLNSSFDGATAAIAAWYIGLMAASPVLDPGDTAAEIGGSNGWTEFVAYSSPAARGDWTTVVDAAATRAISNATTVDYTISGGSSTVSGIFIASASAKSATTGLIWATAQFASPATVTGGDTLKVTYTVSG